MQLSPLTILILSNLLLLALNLSENLLYFRLGSQSKTAFPSWHYLGIMVGVMILFALLEYSLMPGSARCFRFSTSKN